MQIGRHVGGSHVQTHKQSCSSPTSADQVVSYRSGWHPADAGDEDARVHLRAGACAATRRAALRAARGRAPSGARSARRCSASWPACSSCWRTWTAWPRTRRRPVRAAPAMQLAWDV